MESVLALASGTLALAEILRSALNSDCNNDNCPSTISHRIDHHSNNSEHIFQPRSYFDLNKGTDAKKPVINAHELETFVCATSNDCISHFGNGFVCTSVKRPVKLSISVGDVDHQVKIDKSSINSKRCFPSNSGGGVTSISCHELTSIAVCSAEYSPKNDRYEARWVCENLYPDLFEADPVTGDITVSHACGTEEHRGQLINRDSNLTWNEHYEKYGTYDVRDSLVCECFPFPFHDVKNDRVKYASTIVSRPLGSNCDRSNCEPGTPHPTDPRSCECPSGLVSCPIITWHEKMPALESKLHESLCWGSFIRDLRKQPMPSCVKDPCLPHAVLNIKTGICEAPSDEVKVLQNNEKYPSALFGVPMKRNHTYICGTDFNAMTLKKKRIDLDQKNWKKH
ncbi:U15-like protein [Lissonota sp. PSUC_FEM 10030012]|nr:U15-like protein [Lissonota sp. PSUC_FEM 10030012]